MWFPAPSAVLALAFQVPQARCEGVGRKAAVIAVVTRPIDSYARVGARVRARRWLGTGRYMTILALTAPGAIALQKIEARIIRVRGKAAGVPKAAFPEQTNARVQLGSPPRLMALRTMVMVLFWHVPRNK
jgi:hypothetical protein